MAPLEIRAWVAQLPFLLVVESCYDVHLLQSPAPLQGDRSLAAVTPKANLVGQCTGSLYEFLLMVCQRQVFKLGFLCQEKQIHQFFKLLLS